MIYEAITKLSYNVLFYQAEYVIHQGQDLIGYIKVARVIKYILGKHTLTTLYIPGPCSIQIEPERVMVQLIF